MTSPTAHPAGEQADIRLATIREICRREGHGSLIDVRSPMDAMFHPRVCSRGCDARIYEMPYGWTADVEQVRAFLDKHAGQQMKITRFEVEITPTEETTR